MALNKRLELNESGVFLSYWRIERLDLQNGADRFVVVLGGYIDAKTRADGKKPAEMRYVILPILKDIPGSTGMTFEELWKSDRNWLDILYAKIKVLCPEFVGAEDC